MMSAKTFKAKYSSKIELENFLRNSYCAYIPGHKHIDCYFYIDLISSKKIIGLLVKFFYNFSLYNFPFIFSIY